MKQRLLTMAVLTIAFVILQGLGTSTQANSDFALFDNTNPLTLTEGIQCTAIAAAFTYHISVSNFGSGPNVLRLSYADCDFTRFKIPQDESLNLSGAAHRSNTSPDRTITICGESAQLAGQMSSLSLGNTTCMNVSCGPGGVAPGC